MKKFHRYIYAREFKLVTDHKPLVFLFGEHKDIPEMGASRIQRCAMVLASYNYKIEFRPTQKHANADMCSRFPLQVTEDEGDRALQEDVLACNIDEVVDIFTAKFEDKELLNHRLISTHSRNDVELSKVIRYIREGSGTRFITSRL